jgi:hypothetical protein
MITLDRIMQAPTSFTLIENIITSTGVIIAHYKRDKKVSNHKTNSNEEH